MRENGPMIKQMVGEFIFIKMVQSMKDIGKMISNMERELKLGQMDLNTMVIIRREKSMVKVNTVGLMVLVMMVIGLKIKYVER